MKWTSKRKVGFSIFVSARVCLACLCVPGFPPSVLIGSLAAWLGADSPVVLSMVPPAGPFDPLLVTFLGTNDMGQVLTPRLAPIGAGAAVRQHRRNRSLLKGRKRKEHIAPHHSTAFSTLRSFSSSEGPSSPSAM